jgi:hypothetical protein
VSRNWEIWGKIELEDIALLGIASISAISISKEGFSPKLDRKTPY